ncbi:MAG: hypothetical protein AMXMBFR45_08810 [Gammaproteobacteria bacterium]
MRKIIFSLTALAALVLVETAQAYPVRLLAHNQRSGAGTGQPSVQRWDGGPGCTNYAQYTNCINPASQMAARGMTASTALWDWNPTTGVLSMTGMFNSASSLSSQSMGPMVIGDKVTDLTIDTTTNTTSAATYNCIEGNFLSGVGANGCLNTSIGSDFTDSSSAAYNVGGNANCVVRTIGGDDTSTGNVRTLMSTAGGGGCDPGDGAFNLWEVVQDDTGAGGELIISNNTDLFAAGVNYLTFTRAPDAIDDASDAIPTVATPVNVMANDVAFADPVTVAIGTAPGKGTATVVGSPGSQSGISITYTGDSGETGTDTFTYTVTDANNETDTATVTITLLDVGANNDNGSTTRNKPVTINVGTNDTGFTGDVTVTQVSCDSGGSFTASAPGPKDQASINYTPATTPPGTVGYTEVCTYQITDGTLTDTATVTVTVNNTVPVANDVGQITISTAGVSPTAASGTINVSGITGNNLGDAPATVTAAAGTRGTTSVAGNVITYTPSATFFSGTDTFDYTITDSDPGTAETDTGTITVTIANINPSLAAASITATSGTASSPRALTITAGNGAVSQHTLAVTTQGTNGSCAISGTSVTYTSNAGYVGSDSCVVTVTDGDGSTGTGTVSVTVNAAPSSGGGGTTSNLLPGGGGSLDAWALSLLASGLWLRRKRRAA